MEKHEKLLQIRKMFCRFICENMIKIKGYHHGIQSAVPLASAYHFGLLLLSHLIQ